MTDTTEPQDSGTLVPLNEATKHGVDWQDLSTQKTLTCRNHPTARYLTKNPAIRGLHFVKPCDEAPQAGWLSGGFECPCPFDDLVVVIRP